MPSVARVVFAYSKAPAFLIIRFVSSRGNHIPLHIVTVTHVQPRPDIFQI